MNTYYLEPDGITCTFAKLVENRVLNKDGSSKDTRHLVVDIAGSGLTYKVGDSLGVYASNRPQLVDEEPDSAKLAGLGIGSVSGAPASISGRP